MVCELHLNKAILKFFTTYFIQSQGMELSFLKFQRLGEPIFSRILRCNKGNNLFAPCVTACLQFSHTLCNLTPTEPHCAEGSGTHKEKVTSLKIIQLVNGRASLYLRLSDSQSLHSCQNNVRVSKNAVVTLDVFQIVNYA